MQREMNWTFTCMLSLAWSNEILIIVDEARRLLQAKSNDLFMVVDSIKSTVQVEQSPQCG